MKKKLVSLWRKQGKNGEYFSGMTSDGVRVVAFHRSPESKKNPKQPDLEIFESEMPQQQSAEDQIFGNFGSSDDSVPF